MNWTDFWAALREPLTQTDLLGESGPWVFLVAVVLLCELISDFWLEPLLRRKSLKSAADILARDLNGLRSGVIVAAFSGLTTLEKEAAILALIAGAVTVALRHWKKIRQWAAEQLMGPLGAVLLAFLLGGCSAREACYSRNDAAFQLVVDDCDAAGYTYQECPWLPEAERIQEARDRRCP